MHGYSGTTETLPADSMGEGPKGHFVNVLDISGSTIKECYVV